MTKEPWQLQNAYWVLRHGRSLANEKGLIVSHPEHGEKPMYGLAEEGVRQAKEAAKKFVEVVEDLRERYFGPQLELGSHEKYDEVWAVDAVDPSKGPASGESVADVASRVTQLVERIEAEGKGWTVLLVSHGDTLQILQAVMSERLSLANASTGVERTGDERCQSALARHRSFALETGMLRKIS